MYPSPIGHKKRKKTMSKWITIQENTKTEITEKKSKFIAHLVKINSGEEAEEKWQEMKKKYHDAKHNCMAYRVLEHGKIKEKSSDDGEPSGTAGSPMLAILQNKQLVNVIIIVTRYFGGILLGTGGLVRAYSTSAIQAIELASKNQILTGYEMTVKLGYPEWEKWKYYCQKNQIMIQSAQYLQEINCQIELEEGKKTKLLEDFETKKVILEKIENISKKMIEKSI